MPIVFATFPNGISSEYFASNMENDFESVWFVLEEYACSFKKEERERSEHSKPTTTREVLLKIIIVTRHLTKLGNGKGSDDTKMSVTINVPLALRSRRRQTSVSAW